jgi:hypothetical protein
MTAVLDYHRLRHKAQNGRSDGIAQLIWNDAAIKAAIMSL